MLKVVSGKWMVDSEQGVFGLQLRKSVITSK